MSVDQLDALLELRELRDALDVARHKWATVSSEGERMYWRAQIVAIEGQRDGAVDIVLRRFGLRPGVLL